MRTTHDVCQSKKRSDWDIRPEVKRMNVCMKRRTWPPLRSPRPVRCSTVTSGHRGAGMMSVRDDLRDVGYIHK